MNPRISFVEKLGRRAKKVYNDRKPGGMSRGTSVAGNRYRSSGLPPIMIFISVGAPQLMAF